MSTRNALSTRLRSNVDVQLLLRKLGEALSVPVPSDAWGIANVPFPDPLDVDFREKYLVKEIFRKYPGLQLNIDTRQAALSSFYKQEELNRNTNQRLLDLSQSPKSDVASIFYRASRKSVKVLGRFDWDWFLDGLRFGPGSTTRLSRRNATLVGKLTGRPHVTPSASKLAYLVLQNCPQWAYQISNVLAPSTLLELRSSDSLTCVPKNAKTDRTIAIQPDFNVMLQLGVAYVMRKRLHRWNINLNDQSINQNRAKQASRDGRLATVDLSNASNSMTCSLVWKMIGDHPYIGKICDPTWYNIFEALRTEKGLIDGEEHWYELFSAMGNGYTFELESLIFWALATETCAFLGIEPDVTVYGDDIILPVEAVSLFEEVLSYAGFSFNADKTFSTQGEKGIFRESCGGHYLDGRDVTPVYCDTTLDNCESVILLANNLVRWARLPWGKDGRIQPVYNWLISHLPKRIQRTCIPYGEENDGLIKEFDEGCPAVQRNRHESRHTAGALHQTAVAFPPHFIGYRCRTVAMKSRSRNAAGQGGLAAWLYLASVRKFKWPEPVGSLELIQRQERPPPYKIPSLKREWKISGRTVTSWKDIGPWIS